MIIEKTVNGEETILKVQGRLDTATAPDLEKYLASCLGGVTRLIFDFSDLAYISSAGLRVLLSTQKRMNRQGEMIIRHINEVVNEVFEVTGFIDILTVE